MELFKAHLDAWLHSVFFHWILEFVSLLCHQVKELASDVF